MVTEVNIARDLIAELSAGSEHHARAHSVERAQGVKIYTLSNADVTQSLGYFNDTSDASHLCHQHCCVSTDHLEIESRGMNSDLSKCTNFGYLDASKHFCISTVTLLASKEITPCG
ncbi:hypothetical protein VE03_02860 [Pseudogymnoascus sp. 23342-1-I1]|nr:hypothetical protein VE03_02860 [Pseudogymnoascus sp. 23342-1-I1]